jgi:ORMDL family
MGWCGTSLRLTELTPSCVIGAWTIHFVLIIGLKIFFDIVPGVTQEMSWTLTNIIYMFGSYLMFHWVRGVPFEFNAGAYDNLNMWEQIDNGDQYTPAKKFLLSVPIMLFLLSTHYTHYDLTYFIINFLALMAVVIPKLPWVSLLHADGKNTRLIDFFRAIV